MICQSEINLIYIWKNKPLPRQYNDVGIMLQATWETDLPQKSPPRNLNRPINAAIFLKRTRLTAPLHVSN